MSGEHIQLSRRRFLRDGGLGFAALTAGVLRSGTVDDGGKATVMTVRGRIRAGEMGTTLTHEHVLVDFIGAKEFSRKRYDSQHVFETVLPYLRELNSLECQTFIECTPTYLGRDPRLLERLSRSSGLNVITNTGYYGARDNLFLPAHAHSESAEQLADRWLMEWSDGIEGSGIRPGFIKTGVDGPQLSEIHRKLIRAAALTHLGSGLVIAAHTGKGSLAMEELSILKEEGVDGSALIWVHAQAESDPALFARAAETGCWVSLDGFKAADIDRYIQLLKRARTETWFNRLLLSHDAGWYSPGQPGGGGFQGFSPIFRLLLPRMKLEGFSKAEIKQLVAKNPAEAFSIRVRKG